jgi:hypothetical protein
LSDRPTKAALFSGGRFDTGESDRPTNAPFSGERFDIGECDRVTHAQACLVGGLADGSVGDHGDVTKLYIAATEKLTFTH